MRGKFAVCGKTLLQGKIAPVVVGWTCHQRNIKTYLVRYSEGGKTIWSCGKYEAKTLASITRWIRNFDKNDIILEQQKLHPDIKIESVKY